MSDDSSKEGLKAVSKIKGMSELKVSVSVMRREMPDYVKYVQLVAELHRSKYDACISQGFDKAQALELCKKIL